MRQNSYALPQKTGAPPPAGNAGRGVFGANGPAKGSTGGLAVGGSSTGKGLAQFGKGSPGAQAAMSPDTMFQDLLKQDDAAWKEKQGALQDQMGLFQRQAMNLNARTGGTIAGGYASMAGAALGKGMDAFNKGAMEQGDRRRQLMLAWMDRKLQDKRRAEERQWQLDDMSSQRQHERNMLADQLAGSVPTNPNVAVPAPAEGGGGISTMDWKDQGGVDRDSDHINRNWEVMKGWIGL